MKKRHRSTNRFKALNKIIGNLTFLLLASALDRERRKRSGKPHANRDQHLANDIDHVSVTIAGEKNLREQNLGEMAVGDQAANAGVLEGLLLNITYNFRQYHVLLKYLNEQKIAPIDLFI